MTDVNSEVDTDCPESLANQLDEHGASRELITVALTEPHEVDNVSKNHVREQVEQWPLSEVKDRSGHFFTALWQGDVAQAWFRADFTSTRLLLHCLGRELIETSLIVDKGYSPEQAHERMDNRIAQLGDKYASN